MPESPVGRLAQRRERADPRRAARHRRRHRGRLDRLVGQDAALRRLLLDRQRPRRADALDVRRRAARQDGERQRRALPARPGGKVSHFNYFSNDRTVQAIASALLDDAPADFAAIGPLSWAGEDASGTRAARRRRALARRRRRRRGAADRPAVFVLPGILGSNLKRDGKRIWLGFRFVNGLEAARLGSGDGGERRARRPDRQPLRRSHRAPRRQPRGDPVRLRLAPSGRGRGAPPRRGGRRARSTRARDQPAAGAHPRPLDGRPGRAHDGAREARDLAAHDGARRRAPADARHAERRLVVADADALGRRHLRQRAGRLRLAVRQRRRAQGDGRHARLPPAAGRRCSIRRCGLDRTRDLAEARRRRHGAPARAAASGTSRACSARSTNGARRRRTCSTRRSRCAAASTRRRRGAGADAAKMLLVIGHAPFTPGGIVFGDSGLEYTDAVGGGDGRVPLTSALLPGVRTWKLDAVARRPADAWRRRSRPTSSC